MRNQYMIYNGGNGEVVADGIYGEEELQRFVENDLKDAISPGDVDSIVIYQVSIMKIEPSYKLVMD